MSWHIQLGQHITGTNVKILFVSNYWPPHHLGGYELGCSKIVNQLTQDGHDVTVLTNRNLVGFENSRPYGIVPKLIDFRLKSNLLQQAFHSVANYWSFDRVLRIGSYDRVYYFGLNYVGFTMLLHGLSADCTVFAYVSDESYCHFDFFCRFVLRFLRRKCFLSSFLCILLPRISIRSLDSVKFVCTSDYISRRVSETRFMSPSLTTLHWGVEPAGILRDQPLGKCKNVILGGRISHDKGTKFALEVIEEVVSTDGMNDVVVFLLAEIPNSEYGRQVSEILNRLSTKATIKVGYLDSDSMMGLFRAGGVFLFPSVWEEPFSILLLEAMSAGLVVIASQTGGTSEAIQDGKNGYLVNSDDRKSWINLLTSSLNNISQLDDMRFAAIDTVQSRFLMTDMVKKLISM